MKRITVIPMIVCLLAFLVSCENYSNLTTSLTSDMANNLNTSTYRTEINEPTTDKNTDATTLEEQAFLANEIRHLSECNRILITDDFPASNQWEPFSFSTTLEEVLPWLNKMQLYTDTLPASSDSLKNLVWHANIWPSNLYLFISNNRAISIRPYMYLIASENGPLKKYVDNVLTLDDGETMIFIQSSQLYDWLLNNKWKSTFKLSYPN